MNKNQNTSSGLRFNKGKLPWHLVSWKAISELTRVLQFGATKYAPRNWENGLSFSETFASLQRHLVAWYNGEDTDPETGMSHMAHVLCNSMFLMHFILTGTGTDDRPTQQKEQQIERPFVPTHLRVHPKSYPSASKDSVESSRLSDVQENVRPEAVGRTRCFDGGMEGYRSTGVDRD